MARPNSTGTNKTEEKREAKKRVPLGGMKNILTAPAREGYRRRFINDTGDRIERAKEAGYIMVADNVQVGDNNVVQRNKSLGDGARATVDRDGTTAILMELPEELGREDDARKAAIVNDKERAMTEKRREEGFYDQTIVK